ncbi:response regulator [Myceligenerans indicum]|uniref:Response regulator n=1 Tax=Myceligenerans indicum TaxID=2593663 RepID=A0ABS1LPG6_9MICO|nr:response regulator [Myceligenerans indicum]MBL0887447.1 response regulator [Myceligenerans indicum]
MENRRPIEILLVEDDPGDVLMTQEAFAEHASPVHVSVAGDGVAALDFLRKQGEWVDAPEPDLVLLDLNLPRMDGMEVLAVVKNDPMLRHIPIVVLTTSDAQEDVVGSYSLHANAYVTKPVDFDKFQAVVRQIDEFFVSTVLRPGH